MRFKKILCGVTAAITLGSLSAVTASADEQAAMKKLLSVSISDINGARNYSYYGNGIIGYDNADDPNVENDIDGMVRIDLEKWRETGEFAYSDVETDFDMTDFAAWYNTSGEFRGESRYKNFCYPDKNIVVKFDSENNKMTTAYSFERGMWCITLPDGYTFAGTLGENAVEYTVYDPNGNKTEDKIVFSGDNENWYYSFDSCSYFTMGSDYKYVGYILAVDNGHDVGGVYGYDLKVYGVKRDGAHDVVYSNEGVYPNTLVGLEVGVNFASWEEILPPATTTAHIYSADDGKLYEFDVPYCVGSDGHTGIPFANLQGKFYGTKGVGYFMYPGSDGKVADEAYALVDLAKADSISKSYNGMSTLDGEIYLVDTFDGKWGYIDSNGNELAFFDDAGDFIGDYAPVVSNGKGYLIDRSMKQISDTISATSCLTCDDGVYRFENDSDFLLVTYSNETVSTPETSEPVSQPESSTAGGYVESASSAPSTSASVPVADSNPSTGIALSFFPIAAAISAVIVIKKKK